MIRLPDWEQRLSALISDNRNRPYEISQWDCLLWPAAAVKAQTGTDYGKDHVGKYDSFASAYTYLNSLGFASPADLLASMFSEIPVGFAQRGDIIIADDGIPAVCIGALALSIGEGVGFVGVIRSQWTRAFAVGDRA